MGEEWFTQAESLFQAAADLPSAERAAFLSERCGDDPGLRTLVERLLARHDEGMGSFLGSFLAPSSSPTRTEGEEEEEPPASHSGRIGPYILRERIGAGGMGEVWRAEQTSPVRRTVALKLIKAGMDSAQVLCRFEAERQALALMDHPYIAKVFDAGVTERGRPYFVMELVHGIPITDYCDTRRLGTKERLELFEKVCEGVQHAHRKAVIHRDIKPTNILVSEVDGTPRPKIIDFGVAKATTRKLTEETVHTALGQMIGTPEYMSPEQADLTSEDVDTRTDVYSLGVVLYELLVGGLPFDTEELRKEGLEGILKTLREKDPLRPSSKISTLGERTTEIAMRRGTVAHRLVGQLKGDLDWIVMRALEKDRNLRYDSPQHLAQDIRRHLRNQPVLAGPPSTVYRSRKFVNRHGVAVAFAATIFLAALLGIVLVTIQNARIAEARDNAVQVIGALEEMLASASPTRSGQELTVRELLDRTAKDLAAKFERQPLISARLHHTVGETYRELGEADAAEEHLRRALRIRRELLGDQDPATIDAANDLASVYRQQGRYEDAEALARATLAIARRALGEKRPETLASMYELGSAYWREGRLEDAEELCRASLAGRGRVLGEEHPATLASMHQLAAVYVDQGRYDEAEELQRRTLETRRRTLGEEHPRTLESRDGLALSYMRQGQLDRAETLLSETLMICRRALGEGHPETNNLRYNLACNVALQGRRSEALLFLWEAIANGYRQPDMWLLEDPDLASLHGDREFEAIAAELERRGEESEATSAGE